MEMKIGIFDSGIGGLTVLHEARKALPQASFYYYADTANVPYGTKSKEEVRQCVLQVVEFLETKQIDALVVACNTATSIGIQDLRARCPFPVIGMEPAVKPALEKERFKKVLVMATHLTLEEDKFQSLVAWTGGSERVISLPMPGLVRYAEAGVFNGDSVKEYIQLATEGIDLSQIGTLVLGCTHFLYFKQLLRQMFPFSTEILDGNQGTVRQLCRKTESLTEKNQKVAPSVTYYASTREGVGEVDFSLYMDFLKNNL